MDEYTPTTEEILRYFNAPAYRINPQREGEGFAEYLERASIAGFHAQMNSEKAARRWLAEHDRVVAANAWDEGDAGRSKLPRCPVCDDRTVSKHHRGGSPEWRHDDDGTLICGGSFTEPVWKDMNPYRITEEGQ